MNSRHICWWYKDLYLYSSLLVLTFVAVKFFVPEYMPNEVVYLLPARQLIDPTFLQHDWTMGQGKTLSILFSTLLVPLWVLLDNAVAVALVGRLLAWVFLIYSLVKFAKELGVKWYSFALGLVLWIYTWQSLAAGEWIIGGVEQKCIAYAFLLLSVTFTLRGRSVVAGLLCGASILFHVLVGGWGAIGITGAMIVCYRDFGMRRIVTFLLSAFVLSLPIVSIAIRYLAAVDPMTPSAQLEGEFNTLLVLQVIPFHLDPNYFLTLKKSLKIFLFSLVTLYALTQLIPKTKGRFLIAMLGILLVIFAAGILARQIEMFWFLKYYPFRTADVLLPLLFWLMVPQLLIQRGLSIIRRPTLAMDKRSIYNVLVILIAFVLMSWGTTRAIPEFVKSGQRFVKLWLQDPPKEERSFDRIAHWIRDHTPESATVIVHPCQRNFWITAERAMIASIKSTPHNTRLLEWHKRMVALNGGNELYSSGFRVCKELTENFHSLDVSNLLAIQDRYGADYYLTTSKRNDLSSGLIQYTEYHYLYDLRFSFVPNP